MSREVGSDSEQPKADSRTIGERMADRAAARWQHTVDYLSKLSGTGNVSGSSKDSTHLPEKPPKEYEIEISINQHSARFTYRGCL